MLANVYGCRQGVSTKWKARHWSSTDRHRRARIVTSLQTVSDGWDWVRYNAHSTTRSISSTKWWSHRCQPGEKGNHADWEKKRHSGTNARRRFSICVLPQTPGLGSRHFSGQCCSRMREIVIKWKCYNEWHWTVGHWRISIFQYGQGRQDWRHR